MVLEVNDMLFTRGEDGVLLAQEVKLIGIPGEHTVKIRPLTRGKLQEIQVKASSGDNKTALEADKELLQLGLVEPKLTEEQIADMKPQFATAIATAILSISLGLTQEEVSEKTNEALIGMQEEELKKD